MGSGMRICVARSDRSSSLGLHHHGAAGALVDADPAPLAVLRHHLVAAVGPPDGHVGAEDEAVVAVDAAPAGEAAGGLALDLNFGEPLDDGDEGAHARGRRPFPTLSPRGARGFGGGGGGGRPGPGGRRRGGTGRWRSPRASPTRSRGSPSAGTGSDRPPRRSATRSWRRCPPLTRTRPPCAGRTAGARGRGSGRWQGTPCPRPA